MSRGRCETWLVMMRPCSRRPAYISLMESYGLLWIATSADGRGREVAIGEARASAHTVSCLLRQVFASLQTQVHNSTQSHSVAKIRRHPQTQISQAKDHKTAQMRPTMSKNTGGRQALMGGYLSSTSGTNKATWIFLPARQVILTN